MEWRQEYRIGIQELDEQHRTLVECISNIEKAVAQYDRQSADAAVVRLAAFVQDHFTLEEGLMQSHGYPRLEEHANDHKQFSVHLRALQEPLLTTDVFRDRIKSLHEWWETHVQRDDKAYALHILKRTALGRS
jgi:hemerythrin